MLPPASRSTTRPIQFYLLMGGICALGAAPLLSLVNQNATAGASATAPNDKPLWKAKGTPTGEVHGGTEGTPFKDKARGKLIEISVRGGSWLDSVRCTWDDEGELEKSDIHGGEGGEEKLIKLAPDEYLIQITGVIRKDDDSAVIGSLTFKTTKRTIGPVGETLDGPRFTLDAPKGQEICGFQGKKGDYLNAIGMICRPRP